MNMSETATYISKLETDNARLKEQVAYEQDRNRNNVACADEQIQSLKADNARLAASINRIKESVDKWGDCEGTFNATVEELTRLSGLTKPKDSDKTTT